MRSRVGFEFRLSEDTSASVAAEMVEALSMSDAEALTIEGMIENAIRGLSTTHPAAAAATASATGSPETRTPVNSGAGNAPTYASVI